MTFKKAKELSIVKWEWLSQYDKEVCSFNYRQDLNNDFPELKDLNSQCGFCTYFNKDCEKCPLDDCLRIGSKWDRWADSEGKEAKALAKQILADIKACEE